MFHITPLLNTLYKSEYYFLHDDGRFPNNQHIPLVLYKGILNMSASFAVFRIKQLLKKNGWFNSWKSGIYTYHHYHSNTHEVLAVIKGQTHIQLGGDGGIRLLISKGDVLIIPAGVAHKNLDGENDVQCVGAYPDGADYNMNFGVASERPRADSMIAAVPLPQRDPVSGDNGFFRKGAGEAIRNEMA